MEIAIPILVFLLFGLPIVAVLTHHRRKMLELQLAMRANDPRQDRELEALRNEVRELRDRLNQQTIEMDGVNRLIRTLAADQSSSIPQPDRPRLNDGL